MNTSYKDLTFEQQQKIDHELDQGEKVLWAGQPKPRMFNGDSLGTFLFGIPWTAFAIFWVVSCATMIWGDAKNVPFPFQLFPLFGVPFVLIGLYMLSSPIRNYLQFKKTIYVVTDSRAITFSGGRSTAIRSYDPEELQEVYRIDHRDGTGDIISDGGLYLLGVSEPKWVEELIQKLAEQFDPSAYNEEKF